MIHPKLSQVDADVGSGHKLTLFPAPFYVWVFPKTDMGIVMVP